MTVFKYKNGELVPVAGNSGGSASSLSFKTIWTGSIIGGNLLDINVSKYKYLICSCYIHGVYKHNFIYDIESGGQQASVAWTDKSTDNNIITLYVILEKTTNGLMFSTRFVYDFPTTGNTVDNNVAFTLIKIVGVR